MAKIRTSKGYLFYRNRIIDFSKKSINKANMTEGLRVLSSYHDRIGINWGPAFGTLIGIVRNDDYLSWSPHFNIYILKEDEEGQRDWETI